MKNSGDVTWSSTYPDEAHWFTSVVSFRLPKSMLTLQVIKAVRLMEIGLQHTVGLHYQEGLLLENRLPTPKRTRWTKYLEVVHKTRFRVTHLMCW